MMEYLEFCNPEKLRSFGKFAAKMSKGKRGFRSDRLQSRASLARHIAKHSTDGKIYVCVHGIPNIGGYHYSLINSEDSGLYN